MPLPDDLAGRLAGRLDLDDEVERRFSPLPASRRAASGGDGLLGRLRLPGENQHVAVGQPLDVVVGEWVELAKRNPRPLRRPR